MSTIEIAKKYVDLVKANKHEEALELFAQDAVSVEAGGPPGKSTEAVGLPAIHAKGKEWAANHEIRASRVDGPWPNGDRFIVRFGYELTHRPTGKAMSMEEAGLFTVKDGKISREEFFYAMG